MADECIQIRTPYARAHPRTRAARTHARLSSFKALPCIISAILRFNVWFQEVTMADRKLENSAIYCKALILMNTDGREIWQMAKKRAEIRR